MSNTKLYTVNAQWVSPSPTMDTAHRAMGAAIYNNAIYLADPVTDDIIKFDPITETFTIINNNPFPPINGGLVANQYQQYGNTLWISDRPAFGSAYNIWTYDLSTNTFINKNVSPNANDPVDGFAP